MNIFLIIISVIGAIVLLFVYCSLVLSKKCEKMLEKESRK